MNVNLRLTYFSLLFTTLISSSFLFFVVATENAKYVANVEAAANTNANAKLATERDATMAANAEKRESSSNSKKNEKILPNYKKVKKLASAAKIVTPIPAESLVRATASVAALEEPLRIDNPLLADSVPIAGDAKIVQTTTNSPYADVDLSPAATAYVADKANEAIAGKNCENSVNVFKNEVPSDNIFVNVDSEENISQHKDTASAGSREHVNTIQEKEGNESLPDISDIPTMLVTEMPLGIVEPTIVLDPLIAAGEHTPSPHQQQQPKGAGGENQTVTIQLPESSQPDAASKDEEIVKINDSGGADPVKSDADNIPSENATNVGIPAAVANGTTNTTTTATTPTATTTANQTAEEVPIPVFSEWAQKQMEAAEKQQALEQEVVNTSTLKKNHTNGNGKSNSMKIRAKNYASPDCGSKIIASNSDASNTGALLSSSKDEYMLSPCGSRIWFVVELCEAIQAQKVELANFELFSSSPKNFTVAVSNRFPTREWSNVGRFVAEDKRTVQSFNLHPHLFGKFVRVDIHSHYSKEHFCPLSLFRVFGTSEFEAFETENHPHGDLDDDDDDEFGMEQQAHVKNNENNLFKSASDAVLSIVKKAAEVLVKPTSNPSQNASAAPAAGGDQVGRCQSYAFGKFNCVDCSDRMVERINHALSCQYEAVYELHRMQRIRDDLMRTQVCAKQYGMEALPAVVDDCTRRIIDVNQSYLISLMPADFVGALCHLEAVQHTTRYTRKPRNEPELKVTSKEDAASVQNLTINQGIEATEDMAASGRPAEHSKVEQDFSTKSAEPIESQSEASASSPSPAIPVDSVPPPASVPNITERNVLEEGAGVPATEETTRTEDTGHANSADTGKETAPDVNIFNIPSVELPNTEDLASGSSAEQSTEQVTVSMESTTAATPRSEEDPNAWDSLENLLVPTVNTRLPEGTPSPSNGGAINHQPKVASSPQSESVFIRLSNRIKTLERNMSLSGQYLEELSRRYKKQVEELQQTLNQQTQTVRTLEEENRRRTEMEQLYSQRNHQLKMEVDSLSLQIQACIVVIICVGTFVLLLLMVGILFYRTTRRQQKALQLALNGPKKQRSATTLSTRKLQQRKSCDNSTDCASSTSAKPEKQRRRSEEAMYILKDFVGELNMEPEVIGDSLEVKEIRPSGASLRQRKVSVYSNSNNPTGNGIRQTGAYKRKGEKHSWPTGLPNSEQAWTHEKAEGVLEDGKQTRHKETNLTNGSGEGFSVKQNRKHQHLKKQFSAPHDFNGSSKKSSNGHEIILRDCNDPAFVQRDFDESLMLDDDDLDNYIPNADLSYNEFMPDGPSGYQVSSTASNDLSPCSDEGAKSDKSSSKKSTSPAFFKSPFTKGIKLKSPSVLKTPNTPHESTSWEWKQQPHKLSTASAGNISSVNVYAKR